jgi:formate C-acetyltransferase
MEAAKMLRDTVPGSEDAWKGFRGVKWRTGIDVRDFIQRNYRPYTNGPEFLAGPTDRTKRLWAKVFDLGREELKKGGLLDLDTETIAGIAAHGPGYIDKDLEVIVGLQTDKPLKRATMPFGGIRMVESSYKAYGYEVPREIKKIFTEYRKTHNQGVFNAYTDEMLRARRVGIITGLPDAYGRGRIIGDYRRVALYGVERLIQSRQEDRRKLEAGVMDDEAIRLREETAEQVQALEELKRMALSYGYDVSGPAVNAQEAVQWVYFAYLGAVKEQNGAAMSLGRVSTFLDIYIQRDLDQGLITEEQAQELIDQLVVKLRMVRFLRTPEYDELFSGDPTWVTEAIGGMGVDGRTLVTKTAFRFLHTLTNLGPAPEPNMTVLWAARLPEPFKKYCVELSIQTCSIQYENDDLMRPMWGDDYAIACCVSAMRVGKQMQFFGARANLAKALLYAINGGWDEKRGIQVGPKFAPITSEYLDYDEVTDRFDAVMEWLARLYINTLNIIHYMHDRYYYERLQFALHDVNIYRTHTKVKTVRNDEGYAVDFEIEGDYPQMGNNDPKVDQIAIDLVEDFSRKLKKQNVYRHADPTLSILTITSNVVYGKKTGNTPDGRKAGEPFAPGANPMHGRDKKGALAAAASVAHLPYEHAMDGISYTFSIVPKALGKSANDRTNNMVGFLDGYFGQEGHHINVNVFDRETLLDAMEHPEKYPQLTIRVSGYAVNFVRLSREQQEDILRRTLHEIV